MPVYSNPKLYGFLLAAVVAWAAPRAHAVELLNVSYDPTRELYADINERFAAQWKVQTGEDL